MIAIQNLSKSYGEQVLFEEASFHVNEQEKIGLIGLNGHGKSTLLKILTGEELADSGEIKIPKEYRLGFLPQHITPREKTVLAEASLGLPEEHRDDEWRVKKVLSGLGFSDQDMMRSPLEFSHGYQMRMALASVLVSNPQMLLLDEPTNFLDILSIRWLKQFLLSWPGELILISHDRGFTDDVITHVVGIHRKNIRKMRGKIAAYEAQIFQEEEVYERERVHTLKVRKKEEEYIQKFRAKARRASQAQSRLKRLEKMDVKDKLISVRHLDFDFKQAPFPTKFIGSLKELSFGYGEGYPLLVDSFQMDMLYGEKIAVIGRNGSGKSTLLSLMQRLIKPLSGEIYWHPQAKIGYFDHRQVSRLSPDLSVEQVIASYLDDERPGESRAIAGAMLFRGDAALKPISVLSGGEKSRVVLGCVIASASNVLLLDEPTHHLDMPSCQALMDAVNRFPGTVVLVTHDEYFLRQVATKLVVFRNGDVQIFNGGYDDFLKKVGWGDKEDQLPDVDKSSLNKKEQRKARAEQLQKRNAVLKPLQTKAARLEEEIQSLEQEKQTIMASMVEASTGQDANQIKTLNTRLIEVNQAVDELYQRLIELHEQIEQVEQNSSDC